MAISINANYYRSHFTGSVGKTSNAGAFDYKASQKEAAQMYDDYKTRTLNVGKLKQESADFLKNYSLQMKKTDAAAGDVRGSKLDSLIGEVSEGKVSDENLKKVTESLQNMVDTYNGTLQTLGKNVDRGIGVQRQMDRMQQSPIAENSMQMVGISTTKDGTLKLDAEKLASAINGAAASDKKSGSNAQMNLIKGVIGGNFGIAAGVQNAAKRGQSTPANTLIANDLAEMQQQQTNNAFNSANLYNRSGSYNFMNMSSIGLLMNVFA